MPDADNDLAPQEPTSSDHRDAVATSRRWRRFYLVAAITIGLASALIRPPLSGTDEFAHFTRVLTLSRGMVIPATDNSMAPRYRIKQCEWYLMAGIFASYHAVAEGGHAHFGDQFVRHRCDPSDATKATIDHSRSPASDVNPPTVFLPAAIGYRLVAPLGGPMLGTLGARLVQLASGVALTWLALRILPRGHALMVPLALIPTIAQVNGLVSPDAVGNGVAFIWFALLLRTIDEVARTGRDPDLRRTLQLATAAIALSLAKPFLAPLLFAVFALPIVRPRRIRALVRSAAMIIPALLVTLSWYVVVVSRLDIVVPTRGAHSGAGAAMIRHHPARFLHAVFNGLTNPTELRQALNELVEIILRDHPGNWATVFALVSITGVAVAWWASRGTGRFAVPRSWQRISVISALVMLELLVIEYGVAISWDVPGTTIVTGLQGRYLLPLVPLAYLATRARVDPPSRTMRNASIAAVILVFVVNVWSLTSSYVHFYV